MVIRYYMKPAPAVDMLGAQAPALIGTWMVQESSPLI